jgi:hypothetical protein
MEEVCFARNDFNLYLVVLACFFAYMIYFRSQSLNNMDMDSNMSILENSLYTARAAEQQCRQELAQNKRSDSINDILLNKISNPLVGPSRLYPGGRFNMPAVRDYQMIGFLYNGSTRYPLFGRQKYSGKSDKWEYYAIDESRNRLKLPFASRNDNELNDGDVISIPGVGDNYNVKIYEYDQFRYDPYL